MTRAKVTRTQLTRYTQDSDNARKRGDRAKDTLYSSITQFGAGRSVVADKDRIVRAGNGTLEAAQGAKLKGFEVDGSADELVVVMRDDWSDEESTAYALMDNRSSELAEWDYDSLKAKCDVFDYDVGFTEADWISAQVEWQPAPEAQAYDEEKDTFVIKVHDVPIEDCKDVAEKLQAIAEKWSLKLST